MKAAFASTAVAWAFGITLALAALALPAKAQDAGTTGARTPFPISPQAAEAQGLGLAEAPQHLFGDWDGFRPYLSNFGIDLNVDFITESGANVSGGLRRGVDYADQIGVRLDVDMEKLADIQGFSLHMMLVNRAGRNLSTDYIGDRVSQAQEIFGAGFAMAVHDVWAYGEEKLLDGRVDAVFGRIFPGMDFAASPFYCDFMTLTICGHPRALTAEQGFIDWPQNTWGGRVRVQTTADTYVMAGIYASEPFPGGGTSGFDWSTSHITGAFYAAELGWSPVFGPNYLPGHYKVGAGYDSSNFQDELVDNNGNPFVLTGQSPKTSHGRTQVWVTFDQMLFRTSDVLRHGFRVLGAYSHDTPDNSLYQDLLWLGALYSGFWKARPDDQIGLAFTHYQISPSLTQTENLEQQFGLPPTYPYGVQSHASVLEANYNFPVYNGIQIQPEIEYFIRPGGVSSVPNAFVLGLKTHVLF
jgi:porin